MNKNDPVFQEFIGYWRLSEEMIAKASKDELAETARILAMQAAHMTRKFGEQPMPDYVNLLSAANLDEESIALLREGAPCVVSDVNEVMHGAAALGRLFADKQGVSLTVAEAQPPLSAANRTAPLAAMLAAIPIRAR